MKLDSALPFTGFGALSEEREPRVGDEALYALILESPEGAEHWLMQLLVEADTTSNDDGRVTIGITVRDLEGGEAAGASESIRVKDLTTGLFSVAVKLHQAASAEPAPAEVVPDGAGAGGEDKPGKTAKSVKSTLSLVKALRRNRQLASMLWRAVEKPTLLSVLLHLGVTADVQLLSSEFFSPSPPLPEWGVESYRIPLKLDLNGSPSLLCSIVAVDPVAPLSVGGGIVSLIAQRPDASTRLTMQLLAARRGRSASK